jgi:hypothetical protein
MLGRKLDVISDAVTISGHLQPFLLLFVSSKQLLGLSFVLKFKKF